ncbi:MAG: hypothetical protein ACI9CB_002590 [Rhodothermales bacterium]|jgi:hypothetical protein
MSVEGRVFNQTIFHLNASINKYKFLLIRIYWFNAVYAFFYQLKRGMVLSSYQAFPNYKMTSSFDLFVNAGMLLCIGLVQK